MNSTAHDRFVARERRLRSVLFVPVALTAWCLPRPVQRVFARVTARCVQRLASRLRARIEKNLTLVASAPPDRAALHDGVRSVLTNYGYSILDFLALRVGRVPRLVRTHGLERLERARTAGRGVIFVTAHLGSWEMAAYFLGRHAEQVALVSFPDEIGWLGGLRTSIRRSQEHDEVLIGSDPMAVLDLLRRLRGGGMVGMQLDRVPGSAFVAVPFGRGRLRVARGPVRLALAADATLLPVFAILRDDGGYELVLEEPIDPRGLDESGIVGRLVSVLERHVLARPTQWLMMQDPWLDGVEAPVEPGRIAMERSSS